MRKDIEQKVKDCIACLATDKNLEYQKSINQYETLKKTNRTRIRVTNRFYRKLQNKNLSGEPQILIAIDHFAKQPKQKEFYIFYQIILIWTESQGT